MKRIPQGDIIQQQYIVKKPTELLDFLLENEIRKSKNAIQSVLRRRLITVNGKLVTQYDHPLKPRDKVAVMKIDQLKKIKKLKGMSIVYEDDSIIVIDKEAGVLSVATGKEKDRTIFAVLNKYLQNSKKYSGLYILHRLDRESSGLMVFAKEMDAQVKIHQNWDLMVPVYNFTAVVEGKMPKEKGEIESWLTENKNFKVFSSSFDNGGSQAKTSYRVLKNNERYSLVEFVLITRKRNQLRAQLEQLQRPIVGDRKYGSKNNPIKRIALHVSEMKIKHPVTGQFMDFKSAMPKVALRLLTANPNT